MLYLSEKDIEKVVKLEEVIEIIEKAMAVYESKQFTQPDRITINRNDEETYLYMPCFTDEVKGTKMLTLFSENAKKGIATIQGLMVLNDNETGKIKCIMDGSAITAYRTGAVGSCGIKHTTPETVTKLGVIGSGVQGFYQSLYASSIRPIKDIYVFDIFEEKAKEFAKKLEAAIPQATIHVMQSSEDVVREAEVILTVTTSRKPVIPNDAKLVEGKHFVGIGSYKPIMQEYPEAVFKAVDDIYIDVDFAKEETGDLINPLKEGWIQESQVHTLGQFLDQKLDVEKTTLYKSVGMALFDIFVANYIYEKAIENKIGTNLD